MLKNRRITVSYGRTINDGNYGSYRSELSIEADINDDDDMFDAFVMLEDELLDELDRALLKISNRFV